MWILGLKGLRRTPKKKEQTQKDLRDKITHVVVEKKRQSVKALFCTEWSP